MLWVWAFQYLVQHASMLGFSFCILHSRRNQVSCTNYVRIFSNRIGYLGEGAAGRKVKKEY
jgi:hypothetical protein